jgi:hypothetical protein
MRRAGKAEGKGVRDSDEGFVMKHAARKNKEKKKRVARCLFVSLSVRGWDERFNTFTPAFGP